MGADGVRTLHAFDVSVLGAGSHVWLSVHSDQGSVFGVPRHMPAWSLPSAHATPVDWLTGAVRQARPEAGAEALAVGQTLTDLVFGVPEVMALLQQARGAAGSAGAQLLVRILAAPQVVSSWPWELLTDPQRPDTFLTTARDVHVVRSGRSRTYPVRQSPIEPPLNLLLVMSSPLPSGEVEEETPFDLYEEKRALLTELRPLVERGLLHVEVEDRPTVERLRSRMAAQRRGFHLFHYLGHAQPAGLKLEQPNGRGRLVSSQRFATLLQQMPDLRLAVFAGCETARAPLGPPDETWPGELSVADYCVRDACPLVVGMQAVLPFGTERLFTRFFYQALTGGQPVVEALRLARLAIADDEFAGGSLVNWAVPTLFVGGSVPGPIADPEARAEPVPPMRRVGLRLGVRQGDLRFISRLSELREAVDVLCGRGRGRARLLHVIGLPGTGKTSFLDRALEELDPGIVQLFISAARLVDAPDSVRELCGRVAEVVQASGRVPAAEAGLAPADWWDRLLEDLADVPLALVIDDGDLLRTGGAAGDAVLDALRRLTQRRSRTRVAVAANEEIPLLTAHLTSDELRRVQLHALSWPEVWQWIRRNLPVLTQYSEADLAPFYYDLPHLEQWEQLADALAARRTLQLRDMPGVVEQIAARVASAGSTPARPPVFGGRPDDGAPTVGEAAPRRALRVAVAGPFTVGRGPQFSRAVTRFAALHRVSGRVVAGESEDVSSTLAELVPLPSPFGAGGTATTAALVSWLEQAVGSGADLLVLDVGSDTPVHEWRPLLERAATEGRLAVASGGNTGVPSYPAWEPTVLAVGALEENGTAAAYSPYFPDVDKPELYAPKRMQGSPVEGMLDDATLEGTTMSALYAAAAAIVVWASDRGLTGDDVRRILVETAVRSPAADGAAPRRLDVEAALAFTRRQLIVDTLQWDPLELGQLLAETGMRPEVALPLLDALVAEGALNRMSQEGRELFEDPKALYLEYARLRQQPSSWERTAALQRLVDRAQDLAHRGRYSAARVKALWASGHDARRVVALGAVQARPELADPAILVEGITSSRSAFEQYQALLAATIVAKRLGGAARQQLAAAVTAARGSDSFERGTDRDTLAATILDVLRR